jgi:hypothetical protein
MSNMDEIPQVTNTPYQELTPTVASQVLNTYGVDPNAVLSSDNIQQTISNPTPAPDDLLGIRSGLLESTGTNAAYSEYTKALAAAQAASQGLSTGLQQLSNRPVSLSKITGQQAQLREVASNEINALNDAANLALQTYQAKKSEADAQFGIREAEISQKRSLQEKYAGAGIKLTDSFDDAISKIEKYQKKAEKDTYKKALKAKAMELGLKTSGNTKKLESRISKYSKSALEEIKKSAAIENTKKLAEIENIKKSTANIGSEGANRGSEGANSGSEGANSGDVNAYVQAYTSGQISAPQIPQKIRDDVLAAAAPVMKQNNINSLSSDVAQFLSDEKNKSVSYDTVFKIAKANYPALSDSEIDNTVKPQFEQVNPDKKWWEFWK